jgi:hypothetical protein
VRKSFFLFLIIVVFTTFVCGLVYVSIQQDLRQSANDPQIQMAEDQAEIFKSGSSFNNPFNPTINMAKSLAPFIMSFDRNAKLVNTSGLLNESKVVPPQGVFKDVKVGEDKKFTWQPFPGVRIAAVLVYYFNGEDHSGFVLAGRNLRETEKREDNLMFQVGISWVVMIIAGFLLIAIREFSKGKR